MCHTISETGKDLGRSLCSGTRGRSGFRGSGDRDGSGTFFVHMSSLHGRAREAAEADICDASCAEFVYFTPGKPEIKR